MVVGPVTRAPPRARRQRAVKLSTMLRSCSATSATFATDTEMMPLSPLSCFCTAWPRTGDDRRWPTTTALLVILSTSHSFSFLYLYLSSYCVPLHHYPRRPAHPPSSAAWRPQGRCPEQAPALATATRNNLASPPPLHDRPHRPTRPIPLLPKSGRLLRSPTSLLALYLDPLLLPDLFPRL